MIHEGRFPKQPHLPRYKKTLDVNLLLQYLGSMRNSRELSLKNLTLKLAILFALTTAQKVQSLHILHTLNMAQEGTAYTVP